MGEYEYNTMPEARLIFEAMKRKSKEDREYYAYMRKKMNTYAYWLSWFVNNKIEIVSMKEETIIWVKEVVNNFLYTILNNMEEVKEVMDKTDFLGEIIEYIQINNIKSNPLSNEDNFDKDIIEDAFKSVMKQKLLFNGTKNDNTTGLADTEK